MKSDELSEKLRTWRVDPQVPASFRRDVWARIAARHNARENSFSARALDWFSSIFAQSRFALAFASLSLAVGMTYAHQQAQETNARSRSQLETRYAVSVSPFLQQPPPSTHH